MKDFLEVIAQQIDKVAAKPMEAVMILGGSFAMWQWIGWWGVLVFLAFLVFIAFMVDVVVYFLSDHQTYASYGDSKMWISGFHPIKARVVVRNFDQSIKKYGEQRTIEELEKLGVTHVTRKEAADGGA